MTLNFLVMLDFNHQQPISPKFILGLQNFYPSILLSTPTVASLTANGLERHSYQVNIKSKQTMKTTSERMKYYLRDSDRVSKSLLYGRPS